MRLQSIWIPIWLLLLNSCVSVSKPVYHISRTETVPVEIEKKVIEQVFVPKVETKTVIKKVPTGCPPFVPPKLRPSPPAPKAAMVKVDVNDHKSIDKILTSYISELRKVNEVNIAAVKHAAREHANKCRK